MKQQISAQLEAILSDEVCRCEQLLQILQKEKAAIKEESITALDTCSKNKQNLLEKMELLNKKKQSLLIQMPHKNTQPLTIEHLISGHESTPTLTKLWQQLQKLAAQCKNQNAINGVAIELSTQSCQQVMDLLRGTSASAQLYSAKGRNNAATASRPLARV